MYTLKINCNWKRIVGKANKGINVENIIGLKSENLKKEREEKKKRKNRYAKLNRGR